MSNITNVQATYGSVPVYESAAKNGKKANPAETVSQPTSDNIELSPSSQDMQKLHELISKMSDTRIKLVEQIKARIKINDYPVENAFNEALRNMVENKIV